MTPSETKWLEELAEWHQERAKEQPITASKAPGTYWWHLTAARLLDVVINDDCSA